MYVPELGGDLVMGLPIQSNPIRSSSLSLLHFMHVRGGKILITGGATRHVLGNSSVKLWGEKKTRSKTNQIRKLISIAVKRGTPQKT
jgi:hypothetical protein